MSLHLEFEPHSWYMGFAIRDNWDSGYDNSNLERPSTDGFRWTAYAADGMTYSIVERNTDTLAELKKQVRQYHLSKRNGYAERILKRGK